MSESPDHDHVVLDEAVFHAYQDVAETARRIVEGHSLGSSLSYYVSQLDAALDVSLAATEIDPGHHVC
jgi:hypothetical protein